MDLSSGIFNKAWPVQLFCSRKAPQRHSYVLKGFKYLKVLSHQSLLKTSLQTPFLVRKYRMGITNNESTAGMCIIAK